ncbi:UDP-GalNAc:beta-1,3-N-acetylgalactosaminyltransferase 1-like [Carcharodon carcharias]|uniref:UDP-GalNAc:beta-1, 3-N-acetylgalactosaminyltransferase 1-like n=1 Tax=Carcharodon carcharias TaxID=13397 RepID=UPI001B7F0A86|nr:UDP-GalNAc:beta-1,3-N-acetylgalactosaminyltransferase 1-like [Carcharodon carcharias]
MLIAITRSMPMNLLFQRKCLFWLCLFILVYVFKTSLNDRSREKINWLLFHHQKPIDRNKFNFTMNPNLKRKDEIPSLVILVVSSPKEVDSRQAIRLTWGQMQIWFGKKVITLFLLGKDVENNRHVRQSLEQENVQFRDIISQDFIDSYDNLTLKTIMAFRWISEFCPNADYVLKADADVFISVKYLVNFLLKINKNISSDFFTGYPLINTKPNRPFFLNAIRQDKSKFQMSKSDYPFSIYPPHCSGFGYVFSGELGLKTYKLMSHVKPIRFEGVYVGIC